MQEKIIILDFGSQTTQLIGRRVRELDTYCESFLITSFLKKTRLLKESFSPEALFRFTIKMLSK